MYDYYYDYYNYYDYTDYYGRSIFSGALVVWYIIGLAIAALTIVAMWKIYTKAGEEGWAAIIPFYSDYILFKIAWGNGWYFLLQFIPIAGFVFSIIAQVKLAKSFGKGGGWACGLIFLRPIFHMIMAFSNDIHYIGPNGGATPPSAGGYSGSGGGYQDPYQRNYQQYQQNSAQNPNYHYQRNEPQGSPGGYCPECGAKAEAGTKFCASCGKQL